MGNTMTQTEAEVVQTHQTKMYSPRQMEKAPKFAQVRNNMREADRYTRNGSRRSNGQKA